MATARTAWITMALLLGAASPPPGDQAGVAGPAEIAAAVDRMERAMKPGQGFAWQPLLEGGKAVAALEVWHAPGRPAVHPDQAEYATVVAGAGTLVSGGTLIEPRTVRADLIDGTRIDNGATRSLKPGDVLMIPAGMPHWFGMTGGRLVLLGTKIAAR